MALASHRLAQRVLADFGATDLIDALIGDLDGERVQAAVVIWARGDVDRLRDAAALAHQDRRDAHARARQADDNWPERLDAELGA